MKRIEKLKSELEAERSRTAPPLPQVFFRVSILTIVSLADLWKRTES